MFGWYQNCFYLCTRFSEVKYSGCSAVRLARQLRELEAPGSNPGIPTYFTQMTIIVVCFFCAHTSQNKRLKVVMIDLDCLCLQEYLTHNHSK